MKFIREYRTTEEDGYIHEYEITGACKGDSPESFYLIKTTDGYVPINEIPFFELWNYAEKCELEINVRTTFRYLRMTKAKLGYFTLIISEIPESNISGFLLAFSEYINRDHQ